MPREQLREQSTRAQVRNHLLERAESHPVAAAGQAVIRDGTPRALDDLARPCCYQNSFTAPVLTMNLPKRPPKLSGCLRNRRNTNILGRPATVEVTFPADRAESAKDTPNRGR